MENGSNLEVILFSDQSLTPPRRQEILEWFRTTLQSAVDKQHANIKKVFVRILSDTPAIFLS
jgi:hypothetical protein